MDDPVNQIAYVLLIQKLPKDIVKYSILPHLQLPSYIYIESKVRDSTSSDNQLLTIADICKNNLKYCLTSYPSLFGYPFLDYCLIQDLKPIN